jgi:hypothetical protein
MMNSKLNEFVGAFCMKLFSNNCYVKATYRGANTIVFNSRKGNLDVSWAVELREIRDANIDGTTLGELHAKEVLNQFTTEQIRNYNKRKKESY